MGTSPGIRHEVTSRPLSGLPALPSAGLLSACQTGSSVGPQVPLVGWGGGSLTTVSPAFSAMPTWKAQSSHLSYLTELPRKELANSFTLRGVWLIGLLGLSTFGDVHFTP